MVASSFTINAKHPISRYPKAGTVAQAKATQAQFSGGVAPPRQVLSHYGNILVQQASALKYYPAIIASLLLVTFRCIISWGSSIKARGTSQQDYVEKQAYSTTFRELGAFLGTYGLMKIFEANRKRHLMRLIGLGSAETKLPIEAPFEKLPTIGHTLKQGLSDFWKSLWGKNISTELAPARLYLEATDDFAKANPTAFLKKLETSRFFKGWMRLSKWFDGDARLIPLSSQLKGAELETVLKAITKYAPITAGAVLATALSGVLLEWFTLHKMDSFTRWLSGAKPQASSAMPLLRGAVPVAAQPMTNLRSMEALSASQKAHQLFLQFQQRP